MRSYIEKEGSYLMLCRDKEEGDPNSGKWLGVGGHLEPGESPAACLKREVREETGLLVKKYRYCGKVDFLYETVETERMFLYVVDEFEGALHECDEGTLEWIKKEEVPNLKVWDGDRVFLPLLLSETRIFDLALYYNEKGELLDVVGPFYKKEKKQCKKTKRK